MRINTNQKESLSRRGFVAAAAGGAALVAAPAFGQDEYRANAGDPLDLLPTMDPVLAKEVVGKSHSDYDAVKKLVDRHPELAKASIDWGFGDWESALGAASHTGRRNIVELLLANGARMNIFTAAMLGNLDVVRSTIEAYPGIQQVLGPHGFSLRFHAMVGREQAKPVLDYLDALGDANPRYANQPLEQSQIDSITGEYAYSDSRDHRFRIVHEREMIRFSREGSFPRTLFHQGGLVFHPGGAPSVRLRFEISDGTAESVELNITDPALVARRIG